MSIERWWRHALLVDVRVGAVQASTRADEGKIVHVAAHLDDLKALGVDAIVLRDLPEIQPANAASDGSITAWLDNFDSLVQKASSRNMRVLVEVVPSTQEDLTARTRFWLSRGVAGFYLGTADIAVSGRSVLLSQASALGVIRGLVKEYAGDRLVIAQGAPESTVASALAAANPINQGKRRRRRGNLPEQILSPRNSSSGSAEMLLVRIVPPLQGTRADVLRTSLNLAVQRIYASSVTPLLSVSDETKSHADGERPEGKVEAAMLLGFGAQAILEESEITFPDAPSADLPRSARDAPSPGVHGPAASRTKRHISSTDVAGSRSLYQWYLQLDALARANPTFKSGTSVILNRDQDNALVWVRTPPGGGPSIVIACNLSSSPTTFSIADNLQQLHLRGTFLRTLLRSDQGMGAMPLGAVHLLPHAVYIGELRR